MFRSLAFTPWGSYGLRSEFGRWYGGVQNVWGEENVPENALSRRFLDPSKRASGLFCRGFLYRKNRAVTPEGGGKTYRTRGGPKPLFGRGVIREVFHPPLFSTPPWRPLTNCLRVFWWDDLEMFTLTKLIPWELFDVIMKTLSLLLGPKGLQNHANNLANILLKRQFAHKMFVHNFCAPWPPPSQPAKWWISSWISIKRTSNRIANTQPKLRTNCPKIANKQNYEQTGVSEFCWNPHDAKKTNQKRVPWK